MILISHRGNINGRFEDWENKPEYINDALSLGYDVEVDIWFVNGKFSASWKLLQAVVQKPRAQLQGQCFIKLKTQDKEKLKNQTVEDDEPIVISTAVDDSDVDEDPEDEDVEEEVAEVPVPVPVPAPVVEEAKTVKKRVVKKKSDA